MLKSIPALLGPELLKLLAEMGHGDEIAIVDANYPAASAGPAVVRVDGTSATEMVDAILTLLPLDDFVDVPAWCMEVVGDPGARVAIMGEFEHTLQRHQAGVAMGFLQRFDFYERVAGAYAVVQTGERRLYGNLILKKGVVRSSA